MDRNGIDTQKIKELLNRMPEMAPLTEEQKEGFLALWNAYPSYKARQRIYGEINGFWDNRRRYRDVLPEEDKAMFDRIAKDPNSRF